jgi:hypothetical protein
LHRYHRLCQSFDTPWEQRIVVDKMVAAVREVDPLFADRMEDPLASWKKRRSFAPTGNFLKTPMRPRGNSLKNLTPALNGAVPVWWIIKSTASGCLAQAVRSVLGVPHSLLSDDDAIDRVLNPARNLYLSESLNLTTHSKLCRTLTHMHFTFAKKISHTADSQDQRHRMTPGLAPFCRATLCRTSPITSPRF